MELYMNELMAPDIATGAFALACAVSYAAWHEYRQKNHRDAKLLSAIGALSLIGSAMAWLQ